MKNAVLLLVALVLSACGKPHEPAAWETAQSDYICTNEQHTEVRKRADWCTANTGYISTYCYGTATLQVCDKRKACDQRKEVTP